MRVGFIGLGTMGSSMALNLRAAGYDMVVHDIRREAGAPHLQDGASWADSARKVAEAADVVFTSLPEPGEVEQVALSEDGLLAGMRRETAWFDLSTNSPTVVRRLHDLCNAKDVAMLGLVGWGSDRGNLLILRSKLAEKASFKRLKGRFLGRKPASKKNRKVRSGLVF